MIGTSNDSDIPVSEYSSLREELRPSNLSHYWASQAGLPSAPLRGGCNILPSTQETNTIHVGLRAGGFEMKYSGSNSNIYCC